MFVCVFVCQKLSPHLRAGTQVFALLMLFLCVMLHTMWSGKSLQLLWVLPFGMLVGVVVWASGLCVFRELCPLSFLVRRLCCSL